MSKIHKNVLITGANSFIGTSFEKWANANYPNELDIDTVDTIDGSWEKADFSKYDVVYHVAGIAHADVGKVSDEQKQLYYKINTDLAVNVAQKAKSSGVGQFVLMSSMIIYGESAGLGKQKIITNDTVPSPANFYGDSKWQADKAINKMNGDGFSVAVIRPPMIYGKGSKGNYPMLAKLAKKLPIFPNIKNQRSMLHIDNLCEFLCQLMLSGRSGVFFPQNESYVGTCCMVKKIALTGEHNILITKVLNPFVVLAGHIPGKISGLVNKAFGNMTYDLSMSEYEGFDYRVADLDESIRRTEL